MHGNFLNTGDLMILFYMDESGTGLKDRASRYFVLAALAIDARDWSRLDSDITALKRQIIGWARPEDWEIKGRDLRRGDKFFRSFNWSQRMDVFEHVATYLSHFPCRLFAVEVDKYELPHTIESDTDLYRLAFWRLLDMLNQHITTELRGEQGMLLVDMRSDMHSSIQDRRLIDAYRDWMGFYGRQLPFVELPWFGFSHFYMGLQLADFIAYAVDVKANERDNEKRNGNLFYALRNMPEIFKSTIP